MIVCGIDPGLAGGIAVLRDGHEPILRRMPTKRVTRNGKGRDVYDIAAVVAVFEDLIAKSTQDAERLVIAIEKVGCLPTSRFPGGLANFNRGLSQAFEWLCFAFEIDEFEMIPPQVWQREMLPPKQRSAAPGSDVEDEGPDTKERALVAARALMPGLRLEANDRPNAKPHDGVIDALLIALYARNKATGQLFEPPVAERIVR